jgi:hypothetical protein
MNNPFPNINRKAFKTPVADLSHSPVLTACIFAANPLQASARGNIFPAQEIIYGEKGMEVTNG